MNAHSDLFDLSHYTNEFYDESAVNPIKEFVGLRSKMYSIKADNGSEAKRAKGIRTDKIGHGDYKNVLNTNCTKHLTEMKSIRSDRHEIKT